MKTILTIIAMLVCGLTNAQLYVGPGTTLYVPAGATLQVDSLMLVPSSMLTLSNNAIEKTYTAEWAPGGGNASINKVYTIGTPFNFAGTATITYSDAGLNGNTAGSLVMLHAPEVADSLRFSGASSVNTSSRMVSAVYAGPLRIGKFSAGNGANALPISLISFDAWADGNRVKLNWEVATEQNCAGYTIERAADGAHFSPIIQATPKGSNTKCMAYDDQPLQPNNYYRLVSRDLDGKRYYHGVRKVHFSKGNAGLQLSAWPIPAGDVLYVSFSSKPAADAVLTLCDVAGKTIQRISVTAQRMSIPLQDIAAGMYLLRYVGSDGTNTLRVEKQ